MTTALLVIGSATAGAAVDKPADPVLEAVDRTGVLDESAVIGDLDLDSAQGEVETATVTIASDAVMGAGESTIQPGATLIPDVLPETDSVVQEILGGVRIMTIAKGPDAPTRVDYTFPGSVLTAQDDGTVLVEVDGVPASTVLPAWSIDADGNEVPTWYEISGDTLTQVVEHHGAAYPVVSDPASVGFCWLNWLPAICIKYTRAETVTAYNQMALGAAATVVGAALCGKIPFPGAPTACRALLAARAYDLQSSLRSAYSSGKCLDARMTWPIVPGAFIDYRAVNC